MAGGTLKYLLDTHALLWTVEDDHRLGTGARKVLSHCLTSEVGISTISLLEVAMLHSRGRIKLGRQTGRAPGQLPAEQSGRSQFSLCSVGERR